MCIIVYKPTGELCPSWKTLKNCFNNNPDGCGFMYAENDAVHIHKGFMSWKKFKTAFKPLKNRVDIPIVMHFRITTNGGTIPQNTHPFPLSENIGDLRSLDFDCEVGIAHNGIIKMTANATHESDTMEFIRKYAGLIVSSPTWYYNVNANRALAELIGSKMLVLSKDGHGEIVGDGWVHENGVWYSNSTFNASTWTRYLGDWGYGYGEYERPTVSKTTTTDSVKSSWDRDYEAWESECERNARPYDCKYWDYDDPSIKCIDCYHNTWCWSEEQLYEIGIFV